MADARLVEKTHLFDQVYDVLWRKIEAGEILPGERLKDSDWAERLEVSRTPVREAMRKMQQDGILLPMVSGGYQVRVLAASDIVDLYRCRAAMEAIAAEDAAASVTAAQLVALRRVVDDCDAAIERGDLQTAFDLNSRFHALILDLSTNDYVKQICDSLRRMIHFYRKSVLRRSLQTPSGAQVYLHRLRIKLTHHREIADAIERRDGALAARLMQNHVRETAEDLLPGP